MSASQSIAHRLYLLFRSLVSLLLGISVIIAINLLLRSLVDSIIPNSVTAEGLPATDVIHILALVVMLLAGIAGGFVTGILAPRGIMGHVWILALFSLINIVIGVTEYMSMQPIWFRLFVVMAMIPEVLIGGWLAARIRHRLDHDTVVHITA